VSVTEHHLAERFAVDHLPDVALFDLGFAVDQVAGVTGLAQDRREADDPLAGVRRNLSERPDRPVRLEDLVLVEPPPSQPDRNLAHGRGNRATDKSRSRSRPSLRSSDARPVIRIAGPTFRYDPIPRAVDPARTYSSPYQSSSTRSPASPVYPAGVRPASSVRTSSSTSRSSNRSWKSSMVTSRPRVSALTRS